MQGITQLMESCDDPELADGVAKMIIVMTDLMLFDGHLDHRERTFYAAQIRTFADMVEAG